MLDTSFWFFSFGFCTALIWCGYFAFRFSRLASIQLWEILLLTSAFSLPLMLALYLYGISVFGAVLALIVILVFHASTQIKPVKYGTFGTSGRLRMLQYGSNKALIVREPDDIEKIEVLVLSQKQMNALSSTKASAMKESFALALKRDVDVMSLNTYLERKHGYIPVSDRIDLHSVRFHRDPVYGFFKRAFDVVASLILIVLFSIPMMVSAMAIKLLDGSPVLFPQQRMGKGGKPFRIIKFRTMEEGEGATTQATRLGMVLRQLHFDELPQMLNVLMGQMSLIGPRPEWVLLTTPEMAPHSYWLRQVIRPGLTGWAQVNYKPSRTRTMRQRKLGFDLYYINNRSLFLDTLICLRTLFRLPMFFWAVFSNRKRRLQS